MNFLAQILIQVGIYVLGYLLREEPTLPDKTTVEELDIPKIQQGTKLPVVFGTVLIKSPSVGWFGDFIPKIIDGQSNNHIGFVYIWCLNPVDSMNRFFIDDAPIYYADSTSAWATFKASKYINQIPETSRLDKVSSNLKIGMIYQEPKFKALGVDVRFGRTDQEKSEYLISDDAIGTEQISADRGVLTTVFENSNSTVSYYSQILSVGQSAPLLSNALFLEIGIGIVQKTGETITATGIAITRDVQSFIESFIETFEITVLSGTFVSTDIFYDESDNVWFNPYLFPDANISITDKVFSTTNNDLSCMFGEGRVTIPSISASIERTQKDWNEEEIWQPTLATLSFTYTANDVERTMNQMNGIHIIRDIILSKTYGLGRDHTEDDIDDDSFLYAAQTTYDEGMSFGILMDSSQTTADEIFNNIILSLVNGVMYKNSLGKWVVKLLRDDYDTSAIPVFDESSIIKITNWKKDSPASQVNSVTVNYTNPSNFEQAGITARSVTDIQNGGTELNSVVDAPEIYNPDFAALIASRNLQQSMAGLTSFNVTANQNLYDLYPGDVFKLNWDEKNISGLIVRVLERKSDEYTGTLEFACIEDIFSTGTAIISSGNNNWVPVVNQPQPAENRKLLAAPYINYLINNGMDLLTNDEQDNLILIATAPTNDAVVYAPNIDGTSVNTEIQFLDKVTLTEDINIFDTELSLSGDLELPNLTTSDLSLDPVFLLIEDELVALTNLDNINNTITVLRGQIDTIPAPHTSGNYVFVAVWRDRSNGTEPTNYIEDANFVDDYVADVKMLTKTILGTLSANSAPTDEFTFDARQIRPYRPDNVLVNGGRYNEDYIEYISDDDDTLLTWVERNRLTQDSYKAYTEATDMPEDETGYRIIVSNLSGTNQHYIYDKTGTEWEYITGTECSYTLADEIEDFGYAIDKIITITTVRGLLNSLLEKIYSYSTWSITIKRFTSLILTIDEVNETFVITNTNIGCDVYYTITTDGTEPAEPITSDNEYTAPFPFQSDFWIKAKAFCGTGFESESYEIKNIILLSQYDEEDSIYTELNTYNETN